MKEHLKELLDHTPGSRMKLLAAWDGLSAETHIKLLHALANGGRLHQSFHRDIITKALKSPNEYIRYLAARSHDLDKDKAMIERVTTDESPLVRYAQEEVKVYSSRGFNPGFWPESFFDFPREKQLAIVRGQHPPWGSAFAEFLIYAVETKGSSPDDLTDVISEYLNNPEVKKQSYHDEDLWKIIPRMPEGIARKLVMNLSTESGTHEIIPQTVLNSLCGDLLRVLLCRADVRLTKFRREVFLSNNEKYTDTDRIFAASGDLNLGFQEFHSLVQEHSPRLEMLTCPEKFSDEALMWLSVYRCRVPLLNLRLVFLDCLKDYFQHRGVVEQGDSKPCHVTRSMLEHKLEQLQGKLPGKLSYKDKSELLRLKIYRLANVVMPWGGKGNEGELPEPLKFRLAGKIVEGDTWATFMAFDMVLTGNLYPVERSSWYYDYLPVLEELGEIDPVIEPGVQNLEYVFGIKLGKGPDVPRGNRLITFPAPAWLDWAIGTWRRMFR